MYFLVIHILMMIVFEIFIVFFFLFLYKISNTHVHYIYVNDKILILFCFKIIPKLNCIGHPKYKHTFSLLYHSDWIHHFSSLLQQHFFLSISVFHLSSQNQQIPSVFFTRSTSSEWRQAKKWPEMCVYSLV